MNNNNNTTNIISSDANMGEAITVQATELQRAINAVNFLKLIADQLQLQHDTAIVSGTYDSEMAKKVKEARTCLREYKEEAAERFPQEEVFASVKPKTEPSQPLRFREIPCLMAFGEKTREPHGQVYTNVKGFISHLERYCMEQNLSLDVEHPKCMPMLLGNSYRMFVEGKMQSINGRTVSWTMIKGWLLEFVDTPKQRIRNIRALLDLKPEAGESSDKFANRCWSFYDSIEAERFSVNEVVFIEWMSNMPSSWKHKIKDQICSSTDSVMKKSMKEMTEFIGNLEMQPEDRKRKPEFSNQESYKRSNYWKRSDNVIAGEAMKSKWSSNNSNKNRQTGVLCGNRCGKPYCLASYEYK